MGATGTRQASADAGPYVLSREPDHKGLTNHGSVAIAVGPAIPIAFMASYA